MKPEDERYRFIKQESAKRGAVKRERETRNRERERERESRVWRTFFQEYETYS